MNAYTYSAVVDGTQYAIKIYGHGWAINVHQSAHPALGFFAQDEDAAEYVDLFNEDGAEALVSQLLSAGINFEIEDTPAA